MNLSKQPSISGNTVLVFSGQIVTFGAALISLPLILKNLGTERMGVLSLIWIFVGYFSILDLGLGRAVIKTVAEALHASDRESIPGIFWSAALVQSLIGVVGAAFLFGLSDVLIRSVLHIPPHLYAEARQGIIWLSISLPVVLFSSSVVGLLQAAQRFDLTTAIQVPMGALQFLLPLAVSFTRPRLDIVLLSLLAIRLLGMSILFWVAMKIFPGLRRGLAFNRRRARSLITFGSWVTISNIISPLMVYADRFLISHVLSVSAVTYYSVPIDAVMRLLIFPSSLVAALFPVFSSLDIARDHQRLDSLVSRSIKYLLFAVGIPVIILIVSSGDVLRVWIGSDFAQRSALSFQILLVGVLTCSFSYIPFALLQASGRPDITGKIHAIELPIYIALAYFGITSLGIPGAALAWSTRLAVEMVILFVIARRQKLWHERGLRQQHIGSIVSILGALLAAGMLVRPLLAGSLVRILFAGLLGGGGGLWVFRVYFMDAEDKSLVAHLMSWRTRKRKT
jgi:O-antigen/teichoic acid export membrane protein